MVGVKRLRITALLLTTLALLACGLFSSPNPIPTPTPIQSTDTPAPPMPSPTPIRIPGVDDPVSLDEQDMKTAGARCGLGSRRATWTFETKAKVRSAF